VLEVCRGRYAVVGNRCAGIRIVPRFYNAEEEIDIVIKDFESIVKAQVINDHCLNAGRNSQRLKVA